MTHDDKVRAILESAVLWCAEHGDIRHKWYLDGIAALSTANAVCAVSDQVAPQLTNKQEHSIREAVDRAYDDLRFVCGDGKELRDVLMKIAEDSYAEGLSQAAQLVEQEPPFGLALNVKHSNCHIAADAFWRYWDENGKTHKHGYYESTWGAINAAIKLVGVVPHTYGGTILAAPVPQPAREDDEFCEQCMGYGELDGKTCPHCAPLQSEFKDIIKGGSDAEA